MSCSCLFDTLAVQSILYHSSPESNSDLQAEPWRKKSFSVSRVHAADPVTRHALEEFTPGHPHNLTLTFDV